MSLPEVIERKEPLFMNRILGEFRCSGKGNPPPKPFAKPCKSLLLLSWDNLYSQNNDLKQVVFVCPVCQYETNVDLSGFRAQPPGFNIPEKDEYYSKVKL